MAWGVCLGLLWTFGFPDQADGGDFQGSTHLIEFERNPIRYSTSSSETAVDRLSRQWSEEGHSLAYHSGSGYLEGLLEALDIAPASQVLVFAKSSAQRDLISPRNPRAIYFNDEVYVGFIPGAPLLELTAADARLGTVFYTMEQRRQKLPRFERTSQCLECHAASRTMGVPGHLFRSFSVDDQGFVDFTALGDQMTHRLPFAERFGGWYVSGDPVVEQGHGRWLADSDELDFDPGAFPGEGSDVVAMMVLGHQVHFHNYVTRLNFEARIALRQYGHTRYLRAQIEAFLRYLLFVDEAPFPSPISGSSAFSESFGKRAKPDSQGRSLRDFDLEDRLFKYRCSYLIGGEPFEGLETSVRRQVCRRLQQILEKESAPPPFDHLDGVERRAIHRILSETRPGVVALWAQN